MAAGLRALDEQKSRRAMREGIGRGVLEVEQREDAQREAVFRELFVGLGVPFNEQGL